MYFVNDLCVCVCVCMHTVKFMVSDASMITVWPDIIISQILDLSLDILSCFPCCPVAFSVPFSSILTLHSLFTYLLTYLLTYSMD